MKRISIYLFLIVSSRVVGAESNLNACNILFQAPSDSAPVKEKLKDSQSFISSILFKENSSGLNTLDKQWKQQILLKLSQVNIDQLFTLLDRLVLKHNLDIKKEKDFFKQLETALIQHVNSFNKEQLIHILWIFIQWDIKPLNKEFLQAWMASAKTKEFSRQDKLGLFGFLQELRIEPMPFLQKLRIESPLSKLTNQEGISKSSI